MAWVEVFAVFFVSHQVGDYLVQTDWQATNKRGGLGRDAEARRALAAHILTYTLTFIPAFVWIGGEIGTEVVAVIALIAVPHWIQDDGRLLRAYIAKFKGVLACDNAAVFGSVDQAFHLVALLLVALLTGSWGSAG